MYGYECEELYAKAHEDKEILDYIKELKGIIYETMEI